MHKNFYRYYGLLNLEEMLEILQRKIRIADRIRHSQLERHVFILQMFTVSPSFYTITVLSGNTPIRTKTC